MGLDIADFVMDMEDAFGIELVESSVPISTMGELRDVILAQLSKRGSVSDERKDEVWRMLLVLIKRHTRVPRDKIRPESRIVKDLGLD